MKFLFLALLGLLVACSDGSTSVKNSTNEKITTIEINPEQGGQLHNKGMECVLQAIYQAPDAQLDSAAIVRIMYDCMNELYQDMGIDSLSMEEFNQILAIALTMNNDLEQSPVAQEDFPLLLDSAEIAGYSAKDRNFYYEMKANINGFETFEETFAALNHFLAKLKNGEADISADARKDFIFMLHFIKDDLEYHRDLWGNRTALTDSLKKKLGK